MSRFPSDHAREEEPVTAVDTESDQLCAAVGASEFHRLTAHSGGELTFRGREVAVGRSDPSAAGIENQVHLFVTEQGKIVIGLRVGTLGGGPNGPIRDARFQLLREFEEPDGALQWLDTTCPWTEAVDDLREELAQAGG